MNQSSAYEIWAPDGGAWSGWVKPVLFTHLSTSSVESGAELRRQAIASLDVSWAPPPSHRTAVVLDVPGAQCANLALALAKVGYQPVPLFNTTPGPRAVVELNDVLRAIEEGTGLLAELKPPLDAPPAFMLDSQRMTGRPAPSHYDNRWMVFPQDFPSAAALGRAGIRETLVVQMRNGQPADDLRHVLFRWQESGIVVRTVRPEDDHALPIEVTRPGGLRSLWRRSLALLGLRRNSAGGFGAVVPEPSTSSGFRGMG